MLRERNSGTAARCRFQPESRGIRRHKRLEKHYLEHDTRRGNPGLVGTNFVMGYKYYFEEGFSSGTGFMGIAVALLGLNNPFGVVLAALLFGMLDYGGPGDKHDGAERIGEHSPGNRNNLCHIFKQNI